jgi:hypothetical protein
MYSLKIVLFVLFSASVLWANEEPKKEAKQEDFSGYQDDQWIKLQSNIGALKTKLDAQQVIVDQLILAKKTTNSATPEQIEKLKQEHEKLKELTVSYNAQLKNFETRYPEKGLDFKRKYKRKKSLSLEQMESTLTLEGRVKKLNKTIYNQYGYKNPQAEQTKEEKKQQSESKKGETKGSEVTDKLIIQK